MVNPISLVIIALFILVAIGIYDPEFFLKLQKQIYNVLGMDFEYDEQTKALLRLAFIVMFFIISIFMFLMV